MNKSTVKKLQAKLEQKISTWALQRLQRERRLKYMIVRMITIGSLIVLLQAIHIFIPQLIVPPYNSLTTLCLSIWLIVLVVKYSIGYKDKKCTRSADEIIRLAAEYNEASKDIPDARHCDFLPPDLVQQKSVNFATKASRSTINAVPRI